MKYLSVQDNVIADTGHQSLRLRWLCWKVYMTEDYKVLGQIVLAATYNFKVSSYHLDFQCYVMQFIFHALSMFSSGSKQ